MTKTIELDIATFACATLLIISSALSSTVVADESAALSLETKIFLGKVSGRIDHLAVDLPRQRLFVAELGNDTVGVVDLKQRSA